MLTKLGRYKKALDKTNRYFNVVPKSLEILYTTLIQIFREKVRLYIINSFLHYIIIPPFVHR